MSKEYNRCLLCGRRLKDPKCRKIGYGTVCYKKLLVKRTKKSLFPTTN